MHVHVLVLVHVGPENHREYVKSKVVSVEVVPFKPKSNVTIHTTDSEARAAEQGSAGELVGVYGSAAH
jgi:hypothetical protein